MLGIRGYVCHAKSSCFHLLYLLLLLLLFFRSHPEYIAQCMDWLGVLEGMYAMGKAYCVYFRYSSLILWLLLYVLLLFHSHPQYTPVYEMRKKEELYGLGFSV